MRDRDQSFNSNESQEPDSGVPVILAIMSIGEVRGEERGEEGEKRGEK